MHAGACAQVEEALAQFRACGDVLAAALPTGWQAPLHGCEGSTLSPLSAAAVRSRLAGLRAYELVAGAQAALAGGRAQEAVAQLASVAFPPAAPGPGPAPGCAAGPIGAAAGTQGGRDAGATAAATGGHASLRVQMCLAPPACPLARL